MADRVFITVTWLCLFSRLIAWIATRLLNVRIMYSLWENPTTTSEFTYKRPVKRKAIPFHDDIFIWRQSIGDCISSTASTLVGFEVGKFLCSLSIQWDRLLSYIASEPFSTHAFDLLHLCNRSDNCINIHTDGIRVSINKVCGSFSTTQMAYVGD